LYLAQNLKYLRNKAGETQGDIAKLLGVSEMTISRYESGENEPDLKKLVVIAQHFGVSVDEILVKQIKPSLFTRNIRFLQGKYNISDKELALLMGIKEKDLKMCLEYGIENFAYCQECSAKIHEFFGVLPGELNLRDLSAGGD
jgi:transcriptional regulator with XRE-family HTH domain